MCAALPVVRRADAAGAVCRPQVEGTGYDFVRSPLFPLPASPANWSPFAQVPAVLSHPNVTHWLKSTDTDSFATCKRLIRTEGLLVGGSSGASVHAALRWLKSEEGWRVAGGKEGKNVVVVLPDS